ncbi:hypothetical protein [Thalassotalea sp. ND16A]|uniref:hypothetical protein n=1 Tax=Thalassotalea sp. ND16A TaxID=1535422 RepID=UPI00051A10D1|nr:hypothetical protein [Thalassotalea sp. ND16A]KGK01634.1 hypothetical protein ND16A_2918 [Thalassotalea sp. ND16A]
MKESDWKIFIQIKDKAIEKCCSSVLEKSQSVISNKNDDAHKRYLNLYEHIDKSNRKIADLFDGHSRSKAWLQLLMIRREGFADEELVKQLSEEFQNHTNPNKV